MRRRAFLKIAGTASVPLFAVAPRARAASSPVLLDEALGVLVDTTVCIGCRKCEYACDREHSLTGKAMSAFEGAIPEESRRPDHQAFTVVNRYADPGARIGHSFIKVQCMHCNRPACESACIVGALRKDPSGPVSYEEWKCIGCRYCMVACPFQIPAYEYGKPLEPRVRKCTFCAERLARGEDPACVAICPNEALTFGYREDLVAIAHSKILGNPERYADHVYGEEEAGGTSWMYLAGVDFPETSLPSLDGDPIPERTEKIQHGIFKSFLPPLLLYGLLGLVFHVTRPEGAEKDASDE
jgi:Fe-S-cluster-containing dehydrogenase component